VKGKPDDTMEVLGVFGDRFLGTEDVLRIRESENTQSPRLRFRALLTDDGDPRVQLHRA
jgi:hypothetical protein